MEQLRDRMNEMQARLEEQGNVAQANAEEFRSAIGELRALVQADVSATAESAAVLHETLTDLVQRADEAESSSADIRRAVSEIREAVDATTEQIEVLSGRYLRAVAAETSHVADARQPGG